MQPVVTASNGESVWQKLLRWLGFGGQKSDAAQNPARPSADNQRRDRDGRGNRERGLGPIGRLLLGSVSAKVLQLAGIPCLVVP